MKAFGRKKIVKKSKVTKVANAITKAVAPSVYKKPYTERVSRALSNGVKNKFQSYELATDLTVSGSSTTRYYLSNGAVSSIPKYRNDTLATVAMANLHNARQSDKIYLRDMKIHISTMNSSTYTTYIKVWMFRNTSPNEVPATVAAGASNWFKDDYGAISTMAVPPFYASAQPLNTDFWVKKRDLIFQTTIKVTASGDPNGNDVNDRYISKKLGFPIEFEEKGDTTSAGEIKGGNFYVLMAAYNRLAAGTSGGTTSIAVKLITNYSEA